MPRDRTGEGRRSWRSLLPSRLCGQVGSREGVLMQGGCEGVGGSAWEVGHREPKHCPGHAVPSLSHARRAVVPVVLR